MGKGAAWGAPSLLEMAGWQTTAKGSGGCKVELD